MRREVSGWAWVVAAAPFALILAAGAGLYFLPRWADTVSPVSCVALLAASVLTGLCVLAYVLAGWRRGREGFWRAGVLAATLFAALDVAVPLGLAALLWWIVRSFRGRLIPFL